MQVASGETAATPPHPAMGPALLHGLNVPLAALRAAMESLISEMGETDPRTSTAMGALTEVNRIGRVIQELVEYSTPPEPMPLKCTVEEILCSARRMLGQEHRQRLLIARTSRDLTLLVDGPLLAKCVWRLIENALEAGSDYVLLNVRSDADTLVFVTVNRPSGTELDWAWAQGAFRTDKPEKIGLGLTLVRRDVELMGGTLELLRTPRGEVCALVRVPKSPVEKEAA